MALVRGIVVDSSGLALGRVMVTVVGYGQEGVVTKADGGFVLPGHVAEGLILVPHVPRRKIAHHLSPDFNSKSIDRSLITPENMSTLLGIWTLDHEVDLILK